MREHRLARYLKQALLETAINQRHERLRRCVGRSQCRENLLFTLAPMREVREKNSFRIVDHRAVAWKETRRPQRAHTLERREVIGKVSFQIRRDIDRRSLDCEVA